MCPHPGVVPIRHKDRPVRGHTDVARTEPLVLFAGEEDFNLAVITRALGVHGIGANDAGPGIGVENGAKEAIGQVVSLVHV